MATLTRATDGVTERHPLGVGEKASDLRMGTSRGDLPGADIGGDRAAKWSFSPRAACGTVPGEVMVGRERGEIVEQGCRVGRSEKPHSGRGQDLALPDQLGHQGQVL